MRKISKTLAVIGLLTPAGVSALGVGDIRLQSALNQSLRAEIPLVTSGSETLEDIKISIASNEAFAKAGIERQYQISRLHFNAVKKIDGSTVIQVTSQEPIREPFLNFLIEVNWPQGRLLREFTVLLDPPAAYKEETVAQPQLPEVIPSVPRKATASKPRPDEARLSEPSVGEVARTPRAPVGQQTGTEYGPVQKNETLWSIAKLIERAPGITQEQVVVALYQANPQAFYKNSFDALKAGETLRIPDREAIASVTPQEARAQFYGRPAPRAGKLSERRGSLAGEKEASAIDQEQQGKLKLLAPADSKSRTEAAAPGVREESAKAKGDIALEVADTVKQENEEIRSRLAQLEQQLAGMQRLLSLKDEQIANLQAQAGTPSAPAPAVAPSPQPTPAAPVLPPSSTPEPPPAPVQSPAAPESPRIPAAPAEPESPKAPAAPPRAPKPATLVPPAPEEPGFVSFLLEQPALLGGGGLAAALLGFYFWRGFKRRAVLTQESESILMSAGRERQTTLKEVGTPISDQTPSEQVAPSARSSFLSEFSTSDFDALGGEVDEVDPISEADVYLAYGRYKQAEELIRHAIDQYPDRDECKLKLLEIQYATENRAAFEAYAKELFNEHKDSDPDFWEKVVEMGRELCPECPLFSQKDFTAEAGKGESISEADLSASLELDEELLAELKNFDRADAAPTQKAAPIDISQVNSKAPDSDNATGAHGGDFLSYEELEFESTPLTPSDAIEPDADIAFDNLIPFESVSRKTPVEPEVVQVRPDKTLDDILLEMGAVSKAENVVQSPSPDISFEQASKLAVNDDFNMDFSLIKPVTETSIGAEDNTQVVEFDDLNEFETRLDLAKAFVDMGDESSAREILDDVSARGNEVQRREAHTLLEKLSKH
ncbi:FimV family protein [Methylococcus sp. EFPC2]|uniref:FimV family protein n=1 Tax=Methylococcus sp. EFPC2 TaxID=2812648 RepID=UPI0019680507|nr:FimV family protein [Methylococcus sp. EFPC2]QSA98440.1 FimV family protein [Methylococcus sp. EFPC2]